MYSQIFQLHADYYSSLANPKRLEIVHLLRDQEMTVSQMMEMLGFAAGQFKPASDGIKRDSIWWPPEKRGQTFITG